MKATACFVILACVLLAGGAVLFAALTAFAGPAASRPATQPASRPAREMSLELGGNVSMKLVLIPAGTFRMGSGISAEQTARTYGGKAEYFKNEHPQHTVKLTQSFYMGVTEVTQAQYEAVMGSNPSHFKGAKNPVETVSWHDATAFCEKLSRKTGKAIRLPTEAEWEYACRAGSIGRFSFGDSDNPLGEYAWYHGNSNSRTHPVGGKKPNAWGLYDMHGNVWEWCQDGYEEKYPSTMQTDPKGPATARLRVLRGGSWRSIGRVCRSAYPVGISPGSTWGSGGFRVVVSASAGLD